MSLTPSFNFMRLWAYFSYNRFQLVVIFCKVHLNTRITIKTAFCWSLVLKTPKQSFNEIRPSKINCWTSFSFVITCISPYQRPLAIAHHCAVPPALIPLLCFLNSLVKYLFFAKIPNFSLLKSPRFSWKKSRCKYKKWSLNNMQHSSFVLWSVSSLSPYNLDLYSFSKNNSTTPRNVWQAFFSVSVIFPLGFLTSTW